MLSALETEQAQSQALRYLEDAGIVLTPEEKAKIEIADFGLSDLEHWGLELITYINTERVCAKDLVLFPRQTCPEHRHPPIGGEPGKEETFRCRWGEVYVYLPGPSIEDTAAQLDDSQKKVLSVWSEYILFPGDQVTIPPDTLHWFQAGDEGAVVSEFSTRSRDEYDIFTDPCVARATQVAAEPSA